MRKTYQRLRGRTTAIRARCHDVEKRLTGGDAWELLYLSEAALSDLWQAWCSFSRAFILTRCDGGTSRSGAAIPARPVNNARDRIRYEASMLASNKTPNATGTLNQRYREPTWGDVKKLINIVGGLGFTDSNLLQNAIIFNAKTVGHLQIVRNGCAHRSLESLLAIRRLQLYYLIRKPIRHPTDLAWQDHVATNTPAVFKWIDDVENLADVLTTIP